MNTNSKQEFIQGRWFKINKKIKKRITASYDKIKDWVMDPKGYFLIDVDRDKNLLRVGYCKITKRGNFSTNDMVAEIIDCIPPNKICLWEYCIDDKKKGFPHKVEFRIEPKGKNCILNYRVSGTYGGKVQDMSFKPILKGVIIEELLKIKNAIESSEKVPKPLTSETVKPI